MTGRDSKASGGRARVKRWVTWVLSCTVLLAPALLWAAAGDLDTTFGAGGKVTTDFAGSGDEANALVRQSDGKLVAAGGAVTGGPDNFALVRYNADGSLDTTFGVGGKVTTDFAHDADEAVALVQQSDEKLVAAGSAFTGNFYDFALVRYNANGSLDTTFGTGGKVTTAFGGSAHAFALVQQSDGKLVAAGAAFTGSSSDLALV